MNHEQIWAPWRLGFILGAERDKQPKSPDQFLPGADPACFLCRAATTDEPKAHLRIHRGRHTMTVLNRYPYNNGHLLVCPLRHEPRLDSLTDEEHLEAGRETARLLNVLEKHLQCVGFNVGLNLGRVAGAGVPGHLHWHIVPRWDGDTNFMPVLAGTHVIPQSLESLWDLMVEALGERPAK